MTPASFPQLCAPYQELNGSYVPTPPGACSASGLTPLENVETVYQQYVCTGVSPEDENNVTREACVVMGTPLFPTEFDGMTNKAEAVAIFEMVIGKLHRFITCSFLMEITFVMVAHCHPLADTFKTLGTGCLLSGIGLMLAALFVCSCWRKVTKPAHGKIAPGEEDKLLQPQTP